VGTNKYLYNGKEMQDDTIGAVVLNLIDYGHRFYDPQIGRFTTQDAFAEKYHSYNPYHYCFNNPIRFIDINGDSVRLTNAYQNNKQIMNAHNAWLQTDGGKEFMKLFGKGGKFENVAVVFDAVNPDKLACMNADGDEGIELVNSEGKATKIKDGTVSKDVKDAASGKGDGSYIRSTIQIGLYDWENNFLIAQVAETDDHESQHTTISIKSIRKNGVNPTSAQQHSLMLNPNGAYYKSRYNSYWQMRNLWTPAYMEKREEYKKDIIKFVNDQVSGFYE